MNIITATKGIAHVTSMQFRNIMQSIVGDGSYIADLGEQLAPELVSNNSVKIRPGVLFHHGCVYEVPDGTYDEIAIENGTQGMKRIDLIVARYAKNSETGIESCEWAVIKGTPVASNPTIPAYTEGNMQEGDLVDDCPMYEVELDGINVVEVRTLLSVMPNMTDEATTSKAGLMSAVDKAALEKMKADMASLVVDFCGTEVLTNEKIYGKPVYSKMVQLTLGAAGTAVSVSHGASIGTNYYWVDIGNSYIAKDGAIHYPFGYNDYKINVNMNKTNVVVKPADDWTGWTAFVRIKYVK